MLSRQTALLLPLLLVILGCSPAPDAVDAGRDSAADQSYANACQAVANSTFLSVDERECGLTPDGAASCHWSITFTDNGATRSLSWLYSDIGQEMTYTCSGWTITAPAGGGGGASWQGTYDPSTGRLTWDNVQYQKVVR